jgi:tetratricopeptide (TPR) repeat protein
MIQLLPRWGGSYWAMARAIAEAQQHKAQNPRLQLLQGYIAWDRGRVAESAKEHDEALRLYTEALSFGEHWMFLEDRAGLYHRRKQHEQALQDYDRALELRPQMVSVLHSRGNTLYALALKAQQPAGRRELAERSLRDLDLALVLDPTDQRLRRNHGNVTRYLAHGCRCR